MQFLLILICGFVRWCMCNVTVADLACMETQMNGEDKAVDKIFSLTNTIQVTV
jgi:hypothetical protein